MAVLARFQTLREWIEAGHGLPAFERYDQISWFIRTHRDELIRSGTFLPGRGPRSSLVTMQFGGVLERILTREAVRDRAAAGGR
jgi:hypothetical protein